MHVRTHEAVLLLVYDALPRAAQEFLRQSAVELRYYARVPDEVAGDNVAVFGGCALEEAYAHSYKLEALPDGGFRHLTGSAPTVIAQVPRLARNAVREGQFDEARRHLLTLVHYATDLTTPWHVTRELTAEEHKAGEEQIARALARLLPAHVTAQALADPKSLYCSAVAAAEETARLVPRLVALRPGPVTKDPALCREILARCAGFSLAALLYAWRHVEKA